MKKIKFTDCVELVGDACSFYEGEKTYVSTGALAIDKIESDKVELVSYDNKPSRANLVVDNNTIIFAKMQATKKTLLIDETTEQYIYSTGFCAVKPKKNVINEKCLYHMLMSKMFLEQKDKNCSGATQKAITNTGLSKIFVSIPPIEKQMNIAEQLDKVSQIVEWRNRELVKLDELIKARFVELFGDPVSNNMGWGTMPLEKACRSIVDCPHSTPSYTNEDTGYMCIRTSIVKKNKILWDEIEYIPEDEYYKRIQRKKPEKGDIVYTREGAILGIAAIIDRECNVALGQRSMLLSPDQNICTPEFLTVAMNCETFLDNALRGVAGSASPHINVGDIKVFEMIIPPIELQKQFADFVKQVDKSKFAVQKSLEETQLLFDSLMQNYFG